MLEDKKVEIIQLKEILKEFFYERGLSTEIMENPRYETILWKLSSMISKQGFEGNREKAIAYVNTLITIEPNGSLIMVEGGNLGKSLYSTKYEYDENTNELKRFRVEHGHNNNIISKTLSIYNEDGIEISLATEQNLEEGRKYFSQAIRNPSRIDVIKIARTRQNGEEKEVLPEVYQKRVFWAALEDIMPTVEDIDPFETQEMFKYGSLPPIYEDFSAQELEMLEKYGDNFPPVSEKDRAEQLSFYKNNNNYYGRTKAFEKGIAKYLVVKDRSIEEE